MQSVRLPCRASWRPAVVAVWLWMLAVSPLEGQNRLPTASGDWMLRNLRPSGQPVIPLFDGWYHNPDGTFELCFGFHNLNTAQDIEIPLGSDNVIEPARFDGLQPTYFDEVPSEYRRRFCVFTINLEDLEEAPAVVWTLRIGGREYSVPGSSSEHYRMDELEQSSRGNSAPLVRFGALEENERRGRMMALNEWTVSATVGIPVSLEYHRDRSQRHPPRCDPCNLGEASGPRFDCLRGRGHRDRDADRVLFPLDDCHLQRAGELPTSTAGGRLGSRQRLRVPLLLDQPLPSCHGNRLGSGPGSSNRRHTHTLTVGAETRRRSFRGSVASDASIHRGFAARDPTEDETPPEPVLRESALGLPRTVEARYDLSVVVHHLGLPVRPKPRQAVV